jgi:cell division protein FtsB
MALTQEDIWQTLNAEFEKTGKIVSVVELQKILGGSFSTHTKYRKSWLENRGLSPGEVSVINIEEIPSEIRSELHSAVDKALIKVYDFLSDKIDNQRVISLEKENEKYQQNTIELAGLKLAYQQLLERFELNSKEMGRLQDIQKDYESQIETLKAENQSLNARLKE